ncbi:MAG: proteasome subunit beta [Nanoarchaeota archaeon]|nr:proteasome subunit beta [Nanoarchaeota archaeon]MBU1445297.1 proteasome subunit beta [Nanoarchaeota archaeon]MBU2420493.1 proteasome subunit beta [Nanoarchaeota archaeon]MBU2475082.1 proteasome subunit beta [Nanoarchaeota archaeon]MBU3940655.1 proteasome subunit beta [Nanoarchaeota archaeon]
MEEDISKLVKKGTTTVGLVCKDGIVLVADKRSSAGYMIANKKETKIHKISDDMAVTMAGLVSDAQLIIKLVKAELRLKKIRTGNEATVKQAANLLGGILYQNIRKMSMVPGIVAFLLGGKDNTGFKLYELGLDGSITFRDDYCSTGSGSPYAYGVLETLYIKDMTTQQGIEVALKALNAALQRDMPTGDGIDVFTITNEGVRKVETRIIEKKI